MITVTDDVVKVEIWDIVDKGKVKKRDGLKMDTEEADLVNFISLKTRDCCILRCFFTVQNLNLSRF